MPTATVTVRELKNKETGLDLSVTSHRVVPGLLTSTVEYQVLVVSNLQCFKSPRQKETDVVQYSVEKQMNDFEEFRNRLGAKFHGTVLPPLPKRSIMGNEAAITEKRKALDALLSLVAKTPKLSSCSVTLEFLGVKPTTASKFKQQNKDGSKEIKEDKSDLFSEKKNTEEPSQPSSNLFGEEDEIEDLLFGPPKKKELFTDLTDEDYDLFSSKPKLKSAQLFDAEDQDYEEPLNRGVTGTLSASQGLSADADVSTRLDLEDNSELLKIEDDIEKMLSEKKKSADTSPQEDTAAAEVLSPSHQQTPASASDAAGDEESQCQAAGVHSPAADTAVKPTAPKTKPAVPANKPPVGTKPSIPRKPPLPAGGKPVLASKPTVPAPQLGKKPTPPLKKTNPSDQTLSEVGHKSEGSVAAGQAAAAGDTELFSSAPRDVSQLDASDIMNYMKLLTVTAVAIFERQSLHSVEVLNVCFNYFVYDVILNIFDTCKMVLLKLL